MKKKQQRKTASKRLNLHRETLANLDQLDEKLLEKIGGGCTRIHPPPYCTC